MAKLERTHIGVSRTVHENLFKMKAQLGLKSMDALVNHLTTAFTESNIELPEGLRDMAKKQGKRLNELCAELLGLALGNPMPLVVAHLEDSPHPYFKSIFDAATQIAEDQAKRTKREVRAYDTLSWWLSLLPQVAAGQMALVASPEVQNFTKKEVEKVDIRCAEIQDADHAGV